MSSAVAREIEAVIRRRTCTVDHALPRVDVLYDGITFLRAAFAGDGGPMGAHSTTAWLAIPSRFGELQAKREMLRVYTVYGNSLRQEFFDAPASSCRLLALYAPGYGM